MSWDKVISFTPPGQIDDPLTEVGNFQTALGVNP
jgi:hypothetical protein